MLDRDKASLVKDALSALVEATGSAAAWEALPALSRLDKTELNIEIDFRATEMIGTPIVIAREKPRGEPFSGHLTKRQQEVALCLARGLSNKQIARELSISLATTKDHVHAVLSRLGIDSRNKVAALAYGNQA
jgi:DNA-binding NarL/FixJ family response regulator